MGSLDAYLPNCPPRVLSTFDFAAGGDVHDLDFFLAPALNLLPREIAVFITGFIELERFIALSVKSGLGVSAFVYFAC